MLKLVIPKGSLEPSTLGLLEQADLAVRRGSDRDYHGTIEDPRIDRVSILRPQEIPTYVEEGYFDLGITGLDWVEETGAEVEVLTSLHYSGRSGGKARIVLAVPMASSWQSAADLPEGARISTEYPNLTRRAFEKLGTPVKVFLSYGATEAKVPEIVDAVVEVTETGTSLRRSGLTIIETLMESETVLIANRAAAADERKRRAMEDLQVLLLGAMAARGRVLVKLNVAAADLDGLLTVLPAMKSPTVAKLSSGDAYAVETVVEKARINVLIPQLKERGATDIVELPISKIVP
ncbi:MAG TPA: ATP phosphoribosyltransferase [Actinomycetota bacterium]